MQHTLHTTIVFSTDAVNRRSSPAGIPAQSRFSGEHLAGRESVAVDANEQEPDRLFFVIPVARSQDDHTRVGDAELVRRAVLMPREEKNRSVHAQQPKEEPRVVLAQERQVVVRRALEVRRAVEARRFRRAVCEENARLPWHPKLSGKPVRLPRRSDALGGQLPDVIVPDPRGAQPGKPDAPMGERVVVCGTELLRIGGAQPLTLLPLLDVPGHRVDRTRRRIEYFHRIVESDVAEKQTELGALLLCLDRIEAPAEARGPVPQVFEPAPVSERGRRRCAVRVGNDGKGPGTVLDSSVARESDQAPPCRPIAYVYVASSSAAPMRRLSEKPAAATAETAPNVTP